MNHGPLRRSTCILKANVIQSAVLNWGNTFEESTYSYVSCRVSTLKNYKTSTSNASVYRHNIDDETTVYLFEILHDRKI